MAALPPSVDAALRKLAENAAPWAAVPDLERAAVARACRGKLATLDMGWVEKNMRCIGIEPSVGDYYNTESFDPFIFVSIVADRLDRIAEGLEGKLKDLSSKPRRQLGPGGLLVYAMGDLAKPCPGCTLEVWARPGDAGPDCGAGAPQGASLVLGAGNQNFLTACDVVERAFRHKECVFLKQHPLRPFMDGVCAHLFGPLAARGAFAQCGDGDLGGAHGALVCHPAVAHIHMTGSGATHDRIAASLDAGGRGDKVAMTSELGCVSPWIVCPGTANGGRWTDDAIKHHAAMLTSAFKSSCSMNCLSPKVLVLPSEEVWPQRPAFLEALEQRLAAAPDVPPYYPGAHQRYAAFLSEYGAAAKKIEAPPAQPPRERPPPGYPGQDFGALPSLLVDVGTIGAADCKRYALQTEAFAPVLAIATVGAGSAKDFPAAAARAVNEHLFGSLSCTLVYPDARDEAMDAVVSELRYGCVAVNMWVATSYGNSLGAWGAAPGTYAREAPQSGDGFIGNAAGVPNVEKNVVVSPFVNPGVAMAKPIPRVVADSLMVLASGRSMVLPRIMGVMAAHLCKGLVSPCSAICSSRRRN